MNCTILCSSHQCLSIISTFDNKRLRLGSAANGDAVFLHNGSDTILDNQTGNLFFRSASTHLQSLSGEDKIVAEADGAVTLYHNNLPKLSTNSTGIEISANEGNNANIYMTADEGDDNGDQWLLQSQASSNNFNIYNDTSGSLALKFSLKTTGLLDLYGDLVIPDAIVHTGDANTKIRFPAADNISFEVAGVEAARFLPTSAGSGGPRMGLGTNNPTGMLHIYGANPPFRIQNSNDSANLQIGMWDTSNVMLQASHRPFKLATETSHPIVFHTGGLNNERLRIASDGRVMIGTTSPSSNGAAYMLTVADPTNSLGNCGITIRAGTGGGSNTNQGSIFYSNATSGAGEYAGYLQYNHISNWFRIGVNSDEKLRIDSSGNIGINETSPQQQLHVHDDTNYHGILINGNSAPRIAFARSTTTTGEWSVGVDGTNGNNFCINRSNDNSNRLFVIGNGQTNSNQNTAITGILYNNEIVSITSTNDDSTSHVSISARNAAGGYGNYCIIGTSGNTYFGAGANNYSSNPSGNNINGGTTIRVYGGVSSNAYNDAHRFGRNTDGSIVIFQSAGGTEGSIAISGSTTNYNTSSDYRLKENIVNITDGITRLKQLKPRRFNFIKDPSITKDGFIAHEVDSIVSEAVTGTKDETFSKDDEENNIKSGDPKYQQMDASKLIPLLTAALQEAITEIETLKTKVAALEGS